MQGSYSSLLELGSFIFPDDYQLTCF